MLRARVKVDFRLLTFKKKKIPKKKFKNKKNSAKTKVKQENVNQD